MSKDEFIVTVEVVPPSGPDAAKLLAALQPLSGLSFNGFSVATNPVAKPRMDALAFCALLQRQTGKSAILHCTTRDHNRLSLQGLLWGARALEINAVLLASGDFVALADRFQTTTVRDLDVFELVKMAREAELHTGVVFDTHPESNGLVKAVRRLERKVKAGAQFAVTQPVYDEAGADLLIQATQHIDIPIIMGILPLRTWRHAEFLHHKVAGIVVAQEVRDRLQHAEDPIAVGAANAGEMLAVARRDFAGACLMPPFDRYDVLIDILKPPAGNEY